MNLNQTSRAEIVAAVMKDVPRKRKDPAGDLQKLVDADVKAYAPPAIAAIWTDKALACYLNIDNNNIVSLVPDAKGERSYDSPLPGVSATHPEKHEFSANFKDQAQRMYDAMLAEYERIEQARVALTGAVAGLRTVKAFIAAFPELEKYAPATPTASSNLPALANVMAGLVELGWPKEKGATV